MNNKSKLLLFWTVCWLLVVAISCSKPWHAGTVWFFGSAIIVAVLFVAPILGLAVYWSYES